MVPSVASAHAYLIRTVPAASGVLDAPPPNVQLTYDEAVEPRFAIISVTNAAGRQETTGPVRRSPANPDTLVVPLRPRLPQGWYLIYWRAISVDGHPVQGAFTYAVGPNPGPAPQFPVPSIAGSATSLRLLIARWVMFLSVMSAIGLFVFRILIARPAARRRVVGRQSAGGDARVRDRLDRRAAGDPGLSRHRHGDRFAALGVRPDGARAAVPRRPRSDADTSTCSSASRCSAPRRGRRCGSIARPAPARSIAEVISVAGALLAAGAVLLLPGSAGHAAQTSPRGISVALDWVHLATGSLWLGGLIGLIVLWSSVTASERVGALSVVVPRFSNVALVSVALLLGTGTWATINHMPALDALWLTGLRRRDPRQDRAAAGGDGARVRQPAAHQAAIAGRRARP